MLRNRIQVYNPGQQILPPGMSRAGGRALLRGCTPLPLGVFRGCPVTLPLLVLLAGPFGTLDPFGSGSFNNAEGFADFSQMSKVKPLLQSTCVSASVFVPLVVVVS